MTLNETQSPSQQIFRRTMHSKSSFTANITFTNKLHGPTGFGALTRLRSFNKANYIPIISHDGQRGTLLIVVMLLLLVLMTLAQIKTIHLSFSGATRAWGLFDDEVSSPLYCQSENSPQLHGDNTVPIPQSGVTKSLCIPHRIDHNAPGTHHFPPAFCAYITQLPQLHTPMARSMICN